MSDMQKIVKKMRSSDQAAAQQKGTARGYYLVRVSDGARFFIANELNVIKFEQLASKVLTDTDYDYWVDFSYGADTDGKPAWMNIDCTEDFI